MKFNRYIRLTNCIADIGQSILIDTDSIKVYKLFLAVDFDRKCKIPDLNVIPAKFVVATNKEECNLVSETNYVLGAIRI